MRSTSPPRYDIHSSTNHPPADERDTATDRPRGGHLHRGPQGRSKGVHRLAVRPGHDGAALRYAACTSRIMTPLTSLLRQAWERSRVRSRPASRDRSRPPSSTRYTRRERRGRTRCARSSPSPPPPTHNPRSHPLSVHAKIPRTRPRRVSFSPFSRVVAAGDQGTRLP